MAPESSLHPPEINLIDLVVYLLYIYTWVIIIRAVISWLRFDLSNPLIRILHSATEPLLRPLRAVVPPAAIGGLDVSPILAIILIQLVRYLLTIAAS